MDTLLSVPKAGEAQGWTAPHRAGGRAFPRARPQPSALLRSAGTFNLEQVKHSTYFFS